MHILLPLAALVATTTAKCQCGYTVNNTDTGDYALFTDLFETDFLHLNDVNFNKTYTTGWQPQDYTMTPQQSNGPYGMAKLSTNLVPNYIKDRYTWSGPGCKGRNPGLELWARKHLISENNTQLVSCAEIVSERQDILYGSFRIAMKTTAINGTCAAFYFYRNESQEIDLEILSSEQSHLTSEWPVHLVVQNTSNTVQVNYSQSAQLIYGLEFPPGGKGAEYHEYRFDWLPGRIDYYVDSHLMWTETETVPNSPGRLHFSHWSNGNPNWSAGPPKHDAVMTVSYVKAYFNSSKDARKSEYEYACGRTKTRALKDTCVIPDQTIPPNPGGPLGNTTGRTFFFTLAHDMTVNQTLYHNPLRGAAGFQSITTAAFIAVGIAVIVSFVINVD